MYEVFRGMAALGEMTVTYSTNQLKEIVINLL